MISFTVRMRFRSEDRAEIAGALRELAVRSREEPGCVTYVPHTLLDDPDTVLIYEQYRDEAAIEAHRGTPHFEQMATGVLYRLMLERSVEKLAAVA